MPKVSVIIPVFNGERFVGEAVRSVLDQTFRPLEIVVVDDGSTDGTEKVVRQLSSPVPVLYHRQENQGAAAARNVGVSLAQGEWVAFLDADDVWYRDKLAVQIDYMKSYPEGFFFYSDFDVLTASGRRTPRSGLSRSIERPRERWRELALLAFHGQPFPFPSTVLMRKSLFTQLGGFNPAFGGKYYEDCELFVRVARDFPIHFIPQRLVQYRLNPRSQKELHSSANLLILLGCLWQLWGNEPLKQALLVKHYANHYALLGKYCLQEGDYSKAKEYLRLSFSYYPGLYGSWCWKNLRHWALCFLPGLRDLYSFTATRRRERRKRSRETMGVQ